MKVTAIVPACLAGDGRNVLLLREICGEPVLGHVLDRLQLVERLDRIIVATTTAGVDDPIEVYCRTREIACFRGTETAENQLGLVLAALKSVGAKAGAIIDGGSPLIDPAIVDHVVNLIEMTDGMLDFVGNDLAPTYPRGMAAEAFTVPALEDADRRCADPQTRREATLYLRRNSRLYRLLGVKAEGDLDRPDLALDVTREADMDFVTSILRHFDGRIDFSLREIIAYVDART